MLGDRSLDPRPTKEVVRWKYLQYGKGEWSFCWVSVVLENGSGRASWIEFDGSISK